MNSVISDTPGPEVVVKARAPFQPAPTTMPIEAIRPRPARWRTSSSPSGVDAVLAAVLVEGFGHRGDGVIGYQAHTVAPP
jgi:hypothetical protein